VIRSFHRRKAAMSRLALPTLAALALAAGALPAAAHVTLENKEATAGGSFKLVLRVPHGCSGAATTRIRVRIPAEFTSAKPQAKPGWTIEVVKGEGPGAQVGHGHSAAPEEIAWTGRLEEGIYDEFALFVATAKTQQPQAIYVPVVQECGTAVERWIEIPAPGANPQDLKSPAPSFKLNGPT